MNLDLRAGEVLLLRRALRYYATAESSAVSEAATKARASGKKTDREHARDIARQVAPRLEAVDALLARLLPFSKGI